MNRRDPLATIATYITKKRVIAGLFLLIVITLGIGIAFPGLQPSEPPGTQTPTPTPRTTTESPTPSPPSIGEGETSPTEPSTDSEEPTTTPSTPEPLVFGSVPSGESDNTAGQTPTTPADGGLRIRDGDQKTLVWLIGTGYPGLTGQNRTSIENTAEETGDLAITDISYTSNENGLTEPEQQAGDDAASGELHSNFRLSIALEYPNGSVRYLAGGPQTQPSMQTLAATDSLPDVPLKSGTETTLVIDWRIHLAANNTIQSDELVFDMSVTLRNTTD